MTVAKDKKSGKAGVEGTTENKIKEAGGGDAATVRVFLDEISASRKREKDYRKDAAETVKIYEADKKQEYKFNILYANTETLSPALYNATPRPLVERRFKDADPLGATCSKVTQRLVEYLADSNDQDYPSFDDLMQDAVLSALVPGRGVTKFKYEAEIKKTPIEGKKDEFNEEVTYETVCGQEFPWDRVLYGYARRWKDVPWAAYEHTFTPDEMEDNFGPEIAKKVQYSESEKDGDEEKADHWGSRTKDSEGVKLCTVYEVWDKGKKRVLFISPGYKEAPLRETPDPLELSGFFPQPKPLQFFKKIKSLIPTTLYAQYEEQAKELNRVTMRINRIVTMLKVRGAFDKRLAGLDKILQADDGVMTPLESTMMIGEAANLEKALWLVPIEKLVTVLQQLLLHRDQVKKIIFELTGIADVVRGSSAASETLGAQQIKERWGSIRLRRMQKEVQRYCKDAYRIIAEIAVKKLAPATVAGMTGIQLPTEQQKASLMAQVPPGTPLPPQLAQTPTWEVVLQALKSDLTRRYKIDIETNSTVDIDVTEDKKDMNELMAGISQFLNGVAPLIQSGAMPFETAQAFLLTLVRRYRFGSDIEEYIKQMKAPKPPDDGKKEAAMADAAARQQEMQQKAALSAQESKQKHDLAMHEATTKANTDLQIAQIEANTKILIAQKEKEIDAGTQRAEGQRKTQLEREQIAAKERTERAKIVSNESIAEVEKLAANIGKEVNASSELKAVAKALTGLVEKLKPAATGAGA